MWITDTMTGMTLFWLRGSCSPAALMSVTYTGPASLTGRVIPDWPGWQTIALGFPAAGGRLPRELFGAIPSFTVRRSRLPVLLGCELLPEAPDGCALKKALGAKAGFAAGVEPGPCWSACWPAVSTSCLVNRKAVTNFTRSVNSCGTLFPSLGVPV